MFFFFQTQQQLTDVNQPKKILEYDHVKNDNASEQRLKTSHAALDPNHTHFILVDDQQLNKYAGETNLRTKLESALSNHGVEKSSDKIALVILVVSKKMASVRV